MPVAAEKNVYQKLCEGRLPEVPDHLWVATEKLDDPESVIDRAVDLIVAARNESANERGHDANNAYEYLDSVAQDNQHHNDLMRLAIRVAKRTHRYWGVSDPDKERYCSLCRESHPIEQFPEGAYRCDGV